MITQMNPKVRNSHEFVPQAIVKRPPAFFIGRGVSFRTAVDDLNEFKVAELIIDGTPFALMRHEGTPADETEVYFPDNIPLSEVTGVLFRILKEFDISPANIGWVRKSLETPY
jgi:hypothetical protein